ncbi:transposase [Nitrosomonas halophila]|uniref:Transposase n=1 Tax=Nitrosomonas halophila TaxID=44576 RepID=A0A1H3LVS4_9PROT|nr:transposase [Nitrosomonas halophila]
MTVRKQYTKEFKLDAISLVLDQGCTATEVSRNLEINASMLRRWIREYQQDDAGQAFRGNGKLTLEQEEIRKLKIRIKRLEMEKRILKEATVFFAKETK